jgi:hypothetical protein
MWLGLSFLFLMCLDTSLLDFIGNKNEYTAWYYAFQQLNMDGLIIYVIQFILQSCCIVADVWFLFLWCIICRKRKLLPKR